GARAALCGERRGRDRCRDRAGGRARRGAPAAAAGQRRFPGAADERSSPAPARALCAADPRGGRARTALGQGGVRPAVHRARRGDPRTEVIDLSTPRGSDWEPPRTELPFPVVMKAARTADMAGVRFEGKKKVWFLEEPEELAALVRSIAAAGYAGRLVLQELIPGD